MNRFMRGFSLIELMIVVSILAIAIAIGYPSYRNQVMKSNRSDGKIFALEIADREERHYSDQNTYTTTITDLNFDNAISPEGHYTAAITDDPTGDITISYEVTVTPRGPQTDDTCQSMSIDSQGTKSSTPAGCWD